MIQLARPKSRNWPQYRKFSAAPSSREIVVKTLVGVAAVLAVALAWMPDDRMLPPADMHVVTYVKFPRVEVVGKRDRIDPAQPAGQSVEPSSVEFVKDRH